jgi:CBS domain-containing protein
MEVTHEPPAEGTPMKIADILAGKGSTVHSVHPWTTVAAVVDRLAAEGVGALLVRDADGTLRGIVSERDVVLALHEHGATVLGMKVSTVMTRQVRSCAPQETVTHAMTQMTVGRYRHLPVLDQGEIVGLVSIGDLVKHRLHEMELEAGMLRDLAIVRS